MKIVSVNEHMGWVGSSIVESFFSLLHNFTTYQSKSASSLNY